HVSCRQYVIGIRPDRHVLHVIVHVGEAVIHAGRDDDDVAGADFARLRRLLEYSLVAGADRDLHDLAVRGKRLRPLHGTTREQRAGARDDVVDLGHLLVVDRAHGRSWLRRGTAQHADADVVLAHVHDFHLPITTAGG